MKTRTLAATALILTLGIPPLLAQEPPPEKCPMCGMMKKPPPPKESTAQGAELDRLVTEMNGSLGTKKIEAMAAVVTRLVEQYKSLAAPKPSPPVEPPKEGPHQH